MTNGTWEQTSQSRLIDCAVHPQVSQPDDLRAFMDEPWRSRPFPRPERYYYPALDGEFLEQTGSDGLAGSDPAAMAACLFDEHRTDHAILLPLTRGLLPDIDLGSAVCQATNRWLTDTWLTSHNDHGRYAGTVRVNPDDAPSAIAEIERYASDPRIVAVAVPMQARSPYGQRQYFQIWEAAAAHGLPVMIKLDGGSGVDFWPTAVGYPHHYVEYSTLAPINYAYHLISFIAEGTFARLPNLRIVFTDGGHDMLGPLVWRMDKIWRPTRNETPWVKELPSSTVMRHVRFCSRRFEGPVRDDQAERWHSLSKTAELVLFASGYPYHDTLDPGTALDKMQDDCREAVASANAEALFTFEGLLKAA